MDSRFSRKRRESNSSDNAQKIVLEVLKNDFPSIDIEAILGYQVDEDSDSIVGQLVERTSQIVYNFSFSKEDPKVTMQRFI
jgi:hypothetical protein